MENFKKIFQEEIKTLRRIITILNKENFYEFVNSENYYYVLSLIYTRNVIGLRNWYKNQCNAYLENMSIRPLRAKAAEYGIPYYSRMTKAELIISIMEIENAVEKEDGEVK